jgi:ATP-dependent RNA helicase RhlE
VCEGIVHTLVTKNFAAKAINSDRSCNQRWEAMREMLEGNIDILVSTDVLSRGVNIPRVEYIINYDLPTELNSDEYIHRVGRCGRIGNLGRSITFINPQIDWRSAGMLIKVNFLNCS